MNIPLYEPLPHGFIGLYLQKKILLEISWQGNEDSYYMIFGSFLLLIFIIDAGDFTFFQNGSPFRAAM